MWTFLTRVGFRPLPDARVTQDGHAYQPMVLDFGPGSVDGWLAELVANELAVADAVHLDRAGRELVVDERRVPLTPLEFMVMQYLMDREGQAVSRTALLDDVWHDSYQGGSNVVDVVIRSLRQEAWPARLGHRDGEQAGVSVSQLRLGRGHRFLIVCSSSQRGILIPCS